ncbi:toxin-antitoxin system HicB family antitoxin [candidate division KSB1 bacterium]|nr:toxin-antitoxin system HicB family antitoxin [candidate division KSB1 bacterium]
MKKQLETCMKMNYPIEISKIPDDEGGGYMASIPQLGKYAFRGDGENIEEAIRDLNEVKKHLFASYIAKGISIPPPKTEEEKDFSGRFVLRIPAELHRFLALEAKKNGSTLNQYCLYLLTRKSYLYSIQEEVSKIKDDISSVFEYIKKTDYHLEHPVVDEKENCFPIDDYKNSA